MNSPKLSKSASSGALSKTSSFGAMDNSSKRKFSERVSATLLQGVQRSSSGTSLSKMRQGLQRSSSGPSLSKMRQGLQRSSSGTSPSKLQQGIQRSSSGASLSKMRQGLQRTSSGNAKIAKSSSFGSLQKLGRSAQRPGLQRAPSLTRALSFKNKKHVRYGTADDEMNLFMSDMVTEEYCLEKITSLQERQNIRKVEFEDLITSNHCGVLIPKVKSILTTGDRDWVSVKFVDSLPADQFRIWQTLKKNLMASFEDIFQKKESAKSAIDSDAITIQANVEVRSGTSLRAFVSFLRSVRRHRGVCGVEFAGALFGYDKDSFANGIRQCIDDNNNLSEMVCMKVSCGWKVDENWSRLLNACIQTAKDLCESRKPKATADHLSSSGRSRSSIASLDSCNSQDLDDSSNGSGNDDTLATVGTSVLRKIPNANGSEGKSCAARPRPALRKHKSERLGNKTLGGLIDSDVTEANDEPDLSSNQPKRRELKRHTSGPMRRRPISPLTGANKESKISGNQIERVPPRRQKSGSMRNRPVTEATVANDKPKISSNQPERIAPRVHKSGPVLRRPASEVKETTNDTKMSPDNATSPSLRQNSIGKQESSRKKLAQQGHEQSTAAEANGPDFQWTPVCEVNETSNNTKVSPDNPTSPSPSSREDPIGKAGSCSKDLAQQGLEQPGMAEAKGPDFQWNPVSEVKETRNNTKVSTDNPSGPGLREDPIVKEESCRIDLARLRLQQPSMAEAKGPDFQWNKFSASVDDCAPEMSRILEDSSSSGSPTVPVIGRKQEAGDLAVNPPPTSNNTDNFGLSQILNDSSFGNESSPHCLFVDQCDDGAIDLPASARPGLLKRDTSPFQRSDRRRRRQKKTEELITKNEDETDSTSYSSNSASDSSINQHKDENPTAQYNWSLGRHASQPKSPKAKDNKGPESRNVKPIFSRSKSARSVLCGTILTATSCSPTSPSDSSTKQSKEQNPQAHYDWTLGVHVSKGKGQSTKDLKSLESTNGKPRMSRSKSAKSVFSSALPTNKSQFKSAKFAAAKSLMASVDSFAAKRTRGGLPGSQDI